MINLSASTYFVLQTRSIQVLAKRVYKNLSNSKLLDIEDAFQYRTAEPSRYKVIILRNKFKEFKRANLTASSPEKLFTYTYYHDPTKNKTLHRRSMD